MILESMDQGLRTRERLLKRQTFSAAKLSRVAEIGGTAIILALGLATLLFMAWWILATPIHRLLEK